MAVNIYETPIMPASDSDLDVVVFVPGYAIKGPTTPTLVTTKTLASTFGDTPYVFKNNQTATVPQNNALKGSSEKSWLYAKGLVDSGLTVLFQRFTSASTPFPETATAFEIKDGLGSSAVDTKLSFYAKSKYPGNYYSGITVEFEPKSNGITVCSVLKNSRTLESYSVSFDPSVSNYIGFIDFVNVQFVVKDSAGKEIGGLDSLNLAGYISTNTATDHSVSLYVSGSEELASTANSTDEFTISDFESALATSVFNVLNDTDEYPVAYITSGGYFQNTDIVKAMLTAGSSIKAEALVDLPRPVTNSTDFQALQVALDQIKTTNILDKSFGAEFIGCDTFLINEVRIILPDSYGYLIELGENLTAGIPAWVPVANVSRGNISSGVASTRPISKELAELFIGNLGYSINPIIKKQNIGYVIMGNRTLYPNSGILGPQSFLNCRLVVNIVERAARRIASSLLIVSTNANVAFKNFKNELEKTLNKMLANGDGLNAFTIKKLPKTKPATIDIEIGLVCIEGIETFNIYIPYSIALD